MLVVGVDENGLGPRLGPLIATAATIEVDDYDQEALKALGAELQVGDSKQTSAHGRMAHAEGIALALAERELGRVPRDIDDLLSAISLDGLLALRSPCPDAKTARHCWEPRLPLPAFGGDPEEGRAIVVSLRRGGVRITRIRSAVMCAGVLNENMAHGRSKLRCDLSLFERLVLDARNCCTDDVTAICGLVGGIRAYPKYFQRFQHVEPRSESKGYFAYAVRDVGDVIFEIKADDRHLPVGIASMVGKVVRELTMARIVSFFRAHDDALPHASGYHDSVTKRFIADSAPIRKRLAIANACFERTS